MKKTLFLLTLCFLGLSALAQDLLYPTKYRVYKITMSTLTNTLSPTKKLVPGEYQVQKTWNVNQLMVTKRADVQIFNTTGGEYFRTAVGAPVYRFHFSTPQPYRFQTDDGTVHELYSNVSYVGQLLPPDGKYVDTVEPEVSWRVYMSGNKALELEWTSVEPVSSSRKDVPKKAYKLRFYCKPVQ